MNATVERAQSRQGFEDEYPFQSHTLDFDGLRYHYVDEGRGDVVLCVHGNPTWSFAWRNLVKELSPTHRVLAVDHMGCGFSDKPQDYAYRLDQHIRNVCRFVDELDLQRITLVAHDWGGAIGMGAAGRMPERFSRFVLMNTGAFRRRHIPFRIAVCRIPRLGVWAVRGLNAFARAALWMATAKGTKLSPSVRAGYLAPYDNWDHRVAVHKFVEDIPRTRSHPSYGTLLDVENSLQQFRTSPVLLLWGMQDWCFTDSFLREFEDRFPQAESIRLEHASHYLFEDAPQDVVGAVREFLERCA